MGSRGRAPGTKSAVSGDGWLDQPLHRPAGSVWGIMGSFHGLAQVQQATLATVAPGISEALVASAMGLIAAIPAVMSYNRFSAKLDSYMGKYETFADEFSS